MMLVLTYDVDTTTPAGAKRLRQVAKACERYGIRVQNSVFEILVDAAQLVQLKEQLNKLMDAKNDSIRLYRLGNNYKDKIETMGKTPLVQTGGELIL